MLADTPDASLLRLDMGSFSLLLPVGLDAETEADLLAQGLITPASALLLSDSGSANANSEAWIQAINPQFVLISAQAGSRDPAPEVLARLAGRNVLRTDLSGTVTVETDGERVWVEVTR